MRIAIIKVEALGDVLRTTCILKPLHQRYQRPEIWWFTSAQAEPLLERNPYISHRVAIEKISAGLPAEIPEFDLVISLEEDPKAADLADKLSKKKHFGVKRDSTGQVSYTLESAPWFDMGLLNRDPDGGLTKANRLKRLNRRTFPEIILSALGFSDAEREKAEILLFPDPEEEKWAKDFARTHNLNLKRPVVGLNTGSGRRWMSKQLSVEKTLELVQSLGRNFSNQLLLLGGSEEEERNQVIRSRTAVPLIDTGTSNSLARFISIVNLCQVVVTSDSLALHIATALRKKIVAFFGPTSAAEIPLFGRGFYWLPKKDCRCYYASKCQNQEFCLDSLDCGEVLNYLNEARLHA